MKQYLTLQETRERLEAIGVALSLKTIRRYIASGRLQARGPFGGRLYVAVPDIEAFLATGPGEAQTDRAASQRPRIEYRTDSDDPVVCRILKNASK